MRRSRQQLAEAYAASTAEKRTAEVGKAGQMALVILLLMLLSVVIAAVTLKSGGSRGIQL